MVRDTLTLDITVDAKGVLRLMPSISVTRRLTISLLRHPRVLRKVYPLYKVLYRSLPTGYPQLMSGTDAGAKRVRRQLGSRGDNLKP